MNKVIRQGVNGMYGAEDFRNWQDNASSSRELKEFIEGRGLSFETAISNGIGYAPNYLVLENAQENGRAGASYLIAPTGDYSGEPTGYRALSFNANEPTETALIIAGDKEEDGKRRSDIFNASALINNTDRVFLTTGIFDALALMENDYPAVAVFDKESVNCMFEQLDLTPIKSGCEVYIALNSQKDKLSDTIKKGLTDRNVICYTVNLCGSSNDICTSYTVNKDNFKVRIEKEIERVSGNNNVSDYLDKAFSVDVENFKSNCGIKTGFDNLDKASNGIFPAMYILAAISSLGKTTFAIQLAENIAEQGREVYYFALEQSRLELVSKGIARRTYKINPYLAQNDLAIRRGNKTPEITQAIEEYKAEAGKHLHIVEGNFETDINTILDVIKDNGRARPVVFIDYLQVIQSGKDKNGREKQLREAVMANIKELKLLSSRLSIPIFVISSISRAHYLEPISMESLKEDGTIEYTADVVYGMQPSVILDNLELKFENVKTTDTEKRDMIETAKAEIPRRVDIVCLKNRYGTTGSCCQYLYYPQYDLFQDAGIRDVKDKTELQSRKRY